MKIKPLALADHDLWAHLWQNYLTFYETSLPSNTTETTWRNLLDKGKLENEIPTKKSQASNAWLFLF
ncbi:MULTISPECIES: hypothetical protein [Psychrobacter]|jgi:hypothetical protein|uniref:GNAT family N-acetyltransferase n=1 Tax=Psychrobacter pocilloporae TaxID=1775882 RepID=A0ABT6ITN7_9GAMM|nr:MULTISPECIES: hypothetical protein [Psychrobacter]MDH4905173.1 hypothetical protein [Psychrobacter pocilloporae]MED6316295.1 hypothetical protein [Pseudomonadota bacterium]HBD02999.1 hypothetical protein [Psychrobacter sp.]|tara:strand:+ start:22175 stop:22375 length:201 start_codon:yes stop_codon:yes gene_type:complete